MILPTFPGQIGKGEEMGRTQKGFNLISPMRSPGNQIPNFIQP